MKRIVFFLFLVVISLEVTFSLNYKYWETHTGEYPFVGKYNDSYLYWNLTIGAQMRSSPIIDDIDGDNVTEVIFGSDDGYLRVLTGNGTLKWSYYLGSFDYWSPAVYDLNGDSKKEIVVTIMQNDTIWAFYPNGTLYWETNGGDGGYKSLPLIYDFGSGPRIIVASSWSTLLILYPNGSVEYYFSTKGAGDWKEAPAIMSNKIVITTWDWNNNGRVEVWERNGTLVWNKTVSNQDIRQTPIIFNIGNNGEDILIWNGTHVLALNGSNGDKIFSIYLPDYNRASISVGDITSDFGKEIIIHARNSTSPYYTDILVYNQSGIQLWNVTVGIWSWDLPLSSPIIFDVDNDSKKEIIVGTHQFYYNKSNYYKGDYVNDDTLLALENNGSLLWAFLTGGPINGTYSTPSVGDLNGDGFGEIAFGNDNGFFAIKSPIKITFVDPTPQNDTGTNNSWVYVNITTDFEVNTCILNWSGNEYVMEGNLRNWYHNVTNLGEGIYNYQVYCNDSYNNTFYSQKRIVYVDFTAPQIIIYSPQNTTYNSLSFDLNYSVSDNYEVSQCWYILDSNSPVYGCENKTIYSTKGKHLIQVWANDSASNLNYSEVYFTLKAPTYLTDLSFEPQIQARGKEVIISVRLLDQLSQPIPNQLIHFNDTTQNIYIGNSTTDSNGYATIVYNIPSDSTLGYHTIYVYYEGNDTEYYQNSSTQGQIKVSSTPKINLINLSDKYLGIKDWVEIQANVTDEVGIDTVKLILTYPNEETSEFIMNGPNPYTYNFSDTWQAGPYSFYIWVNNTDGISNQSQINYFFVDVVGRLDIKTDKDLYKNFEIVKLGNEQSDWGFYNYTYRKVIEINSSGNKEAIINLKFNASELISQGKLNPNCSDVLFARETKIYELQVNLTAGYRTYLIEINNPQFVYNTHGNDIRVFSYQTSNPYGENPDVPYWVESPSKIWVKASGTIYIYYGNYSAPDLSDASQIFNEIVGLAGIAYINSNGAGDFHWIDFSYSFPDIPLVFSSLMSYNGTQQAFSRIGGVNETGFNLSIQESDGLDQVHNYENVSWVALRKGVWYIYGKKWIVNDSLVDNNYKKINFIFNFSQSPIVLSQIQTFYESDPAKTRENNVNKNSFEVKIEETKDTSHVSEKVAYWAFEPLSLDYLDAGIEYVNQPDTSTWWNFSFDKNFGEKPAVVAKIMSEFGGDNSHERLQNVNSTSFQFKIEEEYGYDGPHTYEYVGWVAVKPGFIYGSSEPSKNYKIGEPKVIYQKYEKIPFWMESCGNVWLKLDLPQGTTQIYMYYGNPNDTTIENNTELDVFSTQEKYGSYVVLGIQGSNLNIGSYKDNTSVTLNSYSNTLGAQQTDIITSGNVLLGSLVYTNGPLSSGTQSSGDGAPLTPLSFAGNLFVLAQTRYYPTHFDFYALEDTNIQVYESDPPGSSWVLLENFTLSRNSAVSKSYNSDKSDTTATTIDVVYKIVSDKPILVFFRGNNDDYMPLLPAQTEFYLTPSNYLVIGALEDGTQINLTFSDGTTQTINLNSGEGYVNRGYGNDGTAPTLHITSNKPIFAYQQADSDGTEVTPGLPPQFMDYIFVFPQDAEYFVAAGVPGNLQCTLYDTTGGVVQTFSDTSTNEPTKVSYGTGQDDTIYINQGYKLVCNLPVHVYYEEASNNAETLLLGPKTNSRYINYTYKFLWEEDKFTNLENNGNETIRGYLYMEVEKWDESWVPILPPVVDDRAFGNLREILPGERLNLTPLFSWDTSNHEPGKYRVLAKLIDENGNLLYDREGRPFYDTYEFEIVPVSLELTNLTHENLYDYNVNEYEAGDTINWINVTIKAINNTAINASITLTLLDENGSYPGFGPFNETQYCENIPENQTCTKQWNNNSFGYLIPKLPSGIYYLTWNVTMWAENGEQIFYNSSQTLKVVNIPSTFQSNLSKTRIYENDSTIYNFTFQNLWDTNLTNVNVTLNCPSFLNCLPSYYFIENLTPQQITFSFNISSQDVIQGDYNITVNLSYNNVGEFRRWSYVGSQILEVRETGILEINPVEYPLNVTRNQYYNLSAYINNTADFVSTNVTFNYTLPFGWTNSSGNLIEYNETLNPGDILWNNITVFVNESSNLGTQTVNLTSKSDQGQKDFKILYIDVWAQTNVTEFYTNDSAPAPNETIILYAKLVLDNGTSLPNQILEFRDLTDNLYIGSNTTNSSGWAQIMWEVPLNSSLGNHTINIKFGGNSSLWALSSESNFTIEIDMRPIEEVNITPRLIGYGQFVNIRAKVIDDDGVDTVISYITLPNGSIDEYEMQFIGNDTWEVNTSNYWYNGSYEVRVWANDTNGNENQTIDYFNLEINASIYSDLIKSEFYPNEPVYIVNQTNRDWWNVSWKYRMPFTINETLSDFQFKIVLNTKDLIEEGKLREDCGDLRIVNSTSALPYWIEPYTCNTTQTIIWFRASSPQTFYVYYGNPDANSEENASQVFLFFDDMETWNGWVTYGSGVVSQDSTRKYEGLYSAHKDSNNDPNGAYKPVGSLGRDIVLEFWVNRNSNYAGGSYDRVGLINDSGGGYGWLYTHGSDAIGIDRRDSYSPTVLATSSSSDYMDKWVRARFTILSNGTIISERFVDGILSGRVEATDTNYNLFTNVYIFGGYDYWVDLIFIHKWGEYSVNWGQEQYIDSAVFNEGNTNFSGYITYEILKKNTQVLLYQPYLINVTDVTNISKYWNDLGWKVGESGNYTLRIYLTNPYNDILNTTQGYLIWEKNFTVLESPINVTINSIAIYENGNLIDSGTNKTFVLGVNRTYQVEINVSIEGYLDLENTSVIYYLNDSWNVSNAYFTNQTQTFYGYTFPPLIWNTSGIANNTVLSFYFTLNLTNTNPQIQPVHFVFENIYGIWEDYSTFQIIEMDNEPPKLFNNTYGLNTTEIIRGQSLLIYARWNESIGEAKVEYNSTVPALYQYNITLPDPNPENWTNYTIETTSLWLLGEHITKIYAEDLSGNWNNTLPYLTFTVYGLAYINNATLSNSSTVLGENLTVYCEIWDDTNSSSISNYTVDFYYNGAYLGSNSTNSSGISQYTFTPNQIGTNNVTCKINAQGFYKIDSRNQTTLTFSVIETEPPQFFNSTPQYLLIHRGDVANLSVYWTDNYELDWALIYINDTLKNSTILSGNESWANFSVLIDESPGFYVWYQKANDTSNNWNQTENYTLEIWGWAEIGDGYLSNYSIYVGNSTIIYCKVIDNYTNQEIQNYTVYFYNSTSLLGTNSTNSSGWAQYIYTDYSEGEENLSCRIYDESYLMYNGSDFMNFTLNTVISGDITPPQALEYGLNDSSIYRGEAFQIYALWNEEINDSYYEINTTQSTIETYPINPPYTNNWTNQTIITNESWILGKHVVKIHAKDQAGNWNHTLPYLEWELWGRSYVYYEDPEGDQPRGNLTIICNVSDYYGRGIPNYYVEFYDSYGYLGSNYTDSLGKAYLTYDFSSRSVGSDTITCVIYNDPNKYYNATQTSDSGTINLLDQLYIDIILPENNSDWYRGDELYLNSSVYDKNGPVTANIYWYNETWDLIGTGQNTTWNIPINYEIGWETIWANATAPNYYNATNKTIIKIWSKSYVNDSYLDKTQVLVNNNVTMYCQILDYFTNVSVSNYTVNFYVNETYIGSNETNSSGWAQYSYNATTNGTYIFKCNISNEPSLFYNYTTPNSREEIFNVTSGCTIELAFWGDDSGGVSFDTAQFGTLKPAKNNNIGGYNLSCLPTSTCLTCNIYINGSDMNYNGFFVPVNYVTWNTVNDNTTAKNLTYTYQYVGTINRGENMTFFFWLYIPWGQRASEPNEYYGNIRFYVNSSG